MGAQSCSAQIKAHSMKEAWRIAIERADEEYGHQQGYSGELNCCELTKDVTHLLKSMGEKKLVEHVYENVPKFGAWGFCKKEPKSNTNKIKTEVETYPQKGARKWVTKYEALSHSNDRVHFSCTSQTECIKKARAYVEKNPNETLYINITKVLEKGNNLCAKVKYKTSKTEEEGIYVFIGLAPS